MAEATGTERRCAEQVLGKRAALHRFLRVAAATTLLGASFAALGSAPGARAGTYVINNCPAAPSPNADPGPWTIFGSPQSAKASCGGGAGDWIGPRGGTMSPGTLAGVAVAVAPGSEISIREARLWWYVPQQSSGATTFAIASSGSGVLGESTTPLDRRGAADVFQLPSSTTRLTLNDYCSNDDAGQGCNFGGGLEADLLLFGSQLTLEESKPPSGSVTGGGLDAGASLSGVQSIAYAAQDDDSGVRSVSLLIDGQIVAQSDYGAQCPYTNFLACPAREAGVISWNSASVPDGRHSAALIVKDAAQNSSVIYAAAITTTNAPPSTSLSTPVGAGVLPATSAGSVLDSTPGAQLSLSVPRLIRRPLSRSAITLTGRLTDSGGRPIPGAKLDVLQQEANTGISRVVAQAQTRADGTFVSGVPRGTSRTIKVAYRPPSSGGSVTAQVSITESVAPAVRLSVSPTRASRGGRITLSGRVSGPVPSQGVLVGLLVRYRGQWEPFRTPRTDVHGRFSVTYQFQGATGRFPFRAQVFGGQAGYPYDSGQSNTVQVTTR
jgi:hypothetical protein